MSGYLSIAFSRALEPGNRADVTATAARTGRSEPLTSSESSVTRQPVGVYTPPPHPTNLPVTTRGTLTDVST